MAGPLAGLGAQPQIPLATPSQNNSQQQVVREQQEQSQPAQNQVQQQQNAAPAQAQQSQTNNHNVLQNQQSEFYRQLQTIAASKGLELLGDGGPICSLVLKDSARALEVMESMNQKGFDVRAIRPPSVPIGESLLRITCPLNRTTQERGDFLSALSLSLEDQ